MILLCYSPAFVLNEKLTIAKDEFDAIIGLHTLNKQLRPFINFNSLENDWSYLFDSHLHIQVHHKPFQLFWLNCLILQLLILLAALANNDIR